MKPDDRHYHVVFRAVRSLWVSGAGLFYASQNLGKFWNTCTRPAERNGFGLSVNEADRRARIIELQFTLIAENAAAVHREWRRLLVAHSVSGVQVHDARLVATMKAAGIARILTFNGSDFKRYPGLVVMHPAAVADLTREQ